MIAVLPYVIHPKTAVLGRAGGVIMGCSRKPSKTIVCWGDSLTAPHKKEGLKSILNYFLTDGSYPAQLQELLGDEYNIINAGVGGENTLTIMARQGSYPMTLAHDVIVFNDKNRKYKCFIGNNDIPAFLSSYNSTIVKPLLQLGYDENSSCHINPCYINGHKFRITCESNIFKMKDKINYEYNYFLEPEEPIVSIDTLKKGSIIETKAMRTLRSAYCNIFFIGQNSGYNNNHELIQQIMAMIKYTKSKRYIIISHHKKSRTNNTISKMKAMEDSLSSQFGKHYINLRVYMKDSALAKLGKKATSEDIDSIKKGVVPPQLLIDGTHFTDEAYSLIATLVKNKMMQLGY